MSLSDDERAVIASAGSADQQTVRQRALTIVLSKTGDDAEVARALLAQSYLAPTQPSFHLIPRGDAMASEHDFDAAYAVLAEETQGFVNVSATTVAAALRREPAALAPLRMIVGVTPNELAVAVQLVSPELRISGARLKNFERLVRPETESSARTSLIDATAATVVAIMNREILHVPEASADMFHSKLDKRDTYEGWQGVQRDARDGVPYSALLYQRYVGGVWRQVQDAYSEVKGDAILERPLSALLKREAISFHRAGRGASGATETAQLFGIAPGPDFLLPATSPTVVIESKVVEDGGSARDKAARIRSLGQAAAQRGLVPCAVVDGKGWRERPAALLEVIIATGGRTFSLSTIDQLLGVPEIAALRGTAVTAP